MKTREEHLQWCKDRALEYISNSQPSEGLTSMFSDLEKHPETAGHPAITLGIMMMAMGSLASNAEAEKFINGFH